jgi:hypothetical protein
MKKGMLVGVVLLCALGAAQTKAPATKKDQARAEPKAPMPVYEIVLSEDSDYQPLPWPKEMRVDFVESDCIGDGNLYVAKPESDLSLTDSGLIGITPKGIVSFLADKITDIPNPNTNSFALHPAISASGVSFTVTGIDDTKVQTTTWTDDEGHDMTIQETEDATLDYITRFGKDGTYKGAIQVDGLSFVINESAAFDSGNLIAQGFDQNRVPRIALLDANAQFLRYLDPLTPNNGASG